MIFGILGQLLIGRHFFSAFLKSLIAINSARLAVPVLFVDLVFNLTVVKADSSLS
jgi:hypothetical protein